jgi:hypothetical protein
VVVDALVVVVRTAVAQELGLMEVEMVWKMPMLVEMVRKMLAVMVQVVEMLAVMVQVVEMLAVAVAVEVIEMLVVAVEGMRMVMLVTDLVAITTACKSSSERKAASSPFCGSSHSAYLYQRHTAIVCMIYMAVFFFAL